MHLGHALADSGSQESVHALRPTSVAPGAPQGKRIKS